MKRKMAPKKKIASKRKPKKRLSVEARVADAVHGVINSVLREIIRDYKIWGEATKDMDAELRGLGHRLDDHIIAIARCVAYIEKQGG